MSEYSYINTIKNWKTVTRTEKALMYISLGLILTGIGLVHELYIHDTLNVLWIAMFVFTIIPGILIEKDLNESD